MNEATKRALTRSREALEVAKQTRRMMMLIMACNLVIFLCLLYLFLFG